MEFLINAKWVQTEARRQGVSLTSPELKKALVEQQRLFRGHARFERYLKVMGLDMESYRARVRLDALRQQLQTHLYGESPVTASQVSNYYRAHRSHFFRPASRDLRAVVTKSKESAEQARTALESGVSWGSALARFADAQAKVGGGRYTVDTANVFDDLKHAAFSAEQDELVGPLHIQDGWWVFTVVRVHPFSPESLDEAAPTIRNILGSSRYNRSLTRLIRRLRQRYRSETVCARGYVVPECSNARPPAESRPPVAAG